MPPVQLLQGIDGEVRTWLLILQLVDAEGGLTGDGEGQHLDPARERRDLIFALVRRPGRGDEPDLIEPSLFPTLLGQDQVALVDWIKGTAEDSDAHDHSPTWR